MKKKYIYKNDFLAFGKDLKEASHSGNIVLYAGIQDIQLKSQNT